MIASTTPGALISYTTNGSTPAATGGTASPVTVTVNAAETINAIAYENGYSASAVAAAAYTIAQSPSTFPEVRINSGGPTYVDPMGRVWAADTHGYGVLSCGNPPFSFVAAGLDGEYTDGLSCGGSNPITYQIPVPNMDYLVTLKFAEPSPNCGPGCRIFSAAVNGQTNTVLSQVDVAANAQGTNKPWDASIPVSVSNSQITIAFSVVNNAPIINAIEIVPANSVEVVPSTATLAARQILQFSALQPGVTNPSPAVNWSITPANLGSIDATGLYTSPASIASAATVTVTAALASNPNIQGTAVISLSPTDPNSFTPLRINSGGPTYIDPLGRVWAADTYGAANCSNPVFSFVAAGLDDEYTDGLSCFGPNPITYHISVPNMDYLVNLKFAEPSLPAGQRLFAVSVNKETNSVLESVDVAANAGGINKPWDTSIPISASTGAIDIAFTPINNAPIINAIEIVPANSLEVTPSTASLGARQILQFSALQPGVTGPAVNWSITPANLGSISATGLYTAPASIASAATVTVTAALASNPNIQGTAAISLSPTDPNSVAPIRINSGGPTYIDPLGRVWAADTYGAANCSNPVFSFVAAGLDGEYTDGLSCNGPNPITYTIPVPNMDYLVTLKFAEPYPNCGPGCRIFSATVNGETNSALESVDVAANAGGPNKPWDTSIPVSVSNGQIVIKFSVGNNTPIINAIQIMPVDQVQVFPATAAPWPSQSVQFQAVVADPVNQAVTWSVQPSGTGTLSSSGLFTAPATVAKAQTLTVTATGVANPNLSASATVNLWPPAGVAMSPQTVSLSAGQTQQFTASPNSGSPLGVTWSISPSGIGTLSATGLYTAPASLDTAQTLTVIATSVGDGSTGAATIHLAPTVTVFVTPATATLGPSEQQLFTANVSGAWNSAVNWSVSPAGMGNITSAGVYTAPSAIAASTNVTITATSVLNSTATGSSTLTRRPPRLPFRSRSRPPPPLSPPIRRSSSLPRSPAPATPPSPGRSFLT
jgi:hypothetical protein